MSALVFIGTFIAALGAFAVAAQRDDEAGGPRRRLFALGIFLGAVLAAAGGFGMRAREASMQAQFETDLRQRTESIMSSVTGGAGYCTITFMRPFTDESRLIVSNRGDTPLYDVTVRISDPDLVPEADAEGKMRLDDLMASQTILSLGNLPAGVAQVLAEPWDFSRDLRRTYDMFFTARNGSWEEHMTLLRENGNWTYTIQVVRGDSVLYEHTDKAYAGAVAEYGGGNGAP